MYDFPWEKDKKDEINHSDNGYQVKCTHRGQRRAYGDSFYEFTIKTDKPEIEAKDYCTEHVYKCDLTTEQYLTEERAGVKDFGDHFRNNYSFKKVKEGEYFYQVISPSTH